MTSCPVTPLSSTVATWRPASGSMIPSVWSPLLATSRRPPAGFVDALVMREPPPAATARRIRSVAALRSMEPPRRSDNILQTRRRKLDRRPGKDALAPQAAAEQRVAGRHVQRAHIASAEDDAGSGRRPRQIDDRGHAARLIEHLQTRARGRVEEALAVGGHGRPGRGRLPRGLEAVEPLAVEQRALGAELERPDPAVAGVDGEQRLIGRE